MKKSYLWEQAKYENLSTLCNWKHDKINLNLYISQYFVNKFVIGCSYKRILLIRILKTYLSFLENTMHWRWCIQSYVKLAASKAFQYYIMPLVVSGFAVATGATLLYKMA